MAKDKDDWEEIPLDTASDQDDWEDVTDWKEVPSEQTYLEPEKMGALEAAVTGAGQGASFGLSPIVAGMTGAASEVAEDLPVQSDLSSVIGGGLVPEVADLIPKDVDTQLQEQGFKIKDEYEGLEGLMQAYYDQRDRQRAQEAKAFEDQPLATLGGGVVGGIASSIAAAPLAAESKLAGAILPKAQALKGATWGQKAAVAAREGAKAGSLAGFGSGEAKLGEGEVLGTLEETAKTGVGGAIMGGGLSSLGSLAGGITKLAQKPLSLPKMGFKAAYKEGLDVLNPDQVRDHIKKSSKEVISIIKKNFNVTGESKRELLEQADELGKRVALGDDINEIVNDIMTDEAWNKQSQKELSGFIEDLYRLDVSRNLDQEKLVAKSQEQLAKMINKESLKGAELIKSGTGIEAIDDLVPKGPEGIVASAEAKLKLPPKNQWSKPKYKDIIAQSSKQDEIVPIAQFDFDSMSLTEADKFKRFVGAMAFPKGEKQEASYLPYAKDLYSRVKEKINTEIQNSSLSDQNKTLHSLYNALESIGIKSKDFFSKDEVTQRKVVNQLVSKMKSSALSEGDLQMDDFIHFLSKVDDNIGTALKEKSNFATQLSEIISTTSSSVSPKILLGPFQQVAAKAGNIVGFGARGAVDFKNQAFKLVKDSSPERVQQLGSELYEAFGEKAVPYINQLGKITNLPERSKNALMFSMFQQPAFRQMLYDLGSKVVGSGVEAKERDNYVERINSSIDDDIISSEPEKKSREPQSESPSISKEMIPNVKITPQSNSFFRPQVNNIDINNVDVNMLEDIENVARDLGYSEMVLSSGKRGIDSTKKILQERKMREGISNLSPEQETILDNILLRGSSPDSIEYPRGNWYNKAFSDLSKVGRSDLIDKVMKIRGDFAGYESPHMRGEKVDVPYSFFIDKYGKEEGRKKAKEFIKELRKSGFEVIDEENAGRYGVIDIKRK